MNTKQELQERLKRLLTAQNENTERIEALEVKKETYERNAIAAINSGAKVPVSADVDKEINDLATLQDAIGAEIAKTRTELQNLRHAEALALLEEQQRLADIEFIALVKAVEAVNAHAGKIREIWRASLLAGRHGEFHTYTEIVTYGLDFDAIVDWSKKRLVYFNGQRRLKKMLETQEVNNERK